jgi:anthranilate phosphoribosyltransferase
MASVSKELGSEHVLAVHGEDGLDEITLTGATRVAELKHGEVRLYSIRPEDFGLRCAPIDSLRGGDPEQNKTIAMDVLGGKTGPCRDMVLLNAGAVVYAGGKAGSIGDGIRLAAESIDSGRAMEKLETLKRLSHST